MKPTTIKTLLAGFGLLASTQLASGQTAVPAAFKVPDAAVDLTKPGFKLRIYQSNTRLQANNVINSERLLSGKAIDPTIGDVFVNEATPNTDGSHWWDLTGVINFHEQLEPPAGGDNFSVNDAAPHNIADDPYPGIPGINGSSDYFAMEFTGFIRVPQGNVQFGVNSDDGFRLTIGDQNQPSINRQQLLVLDGTRGFGNTEGNFSFAQAGLYPFRLTFWEVTGGNSGVEFYAFAPGTTSGSRYLVNDVNQANSIKAFAEAAGDPPTVLAAFPNLTQYVDLAGNGAAVPPAPYGWVDILDTTKTVNPSSVKLLLDGTELAGLKSTKNGPTNTFSAQYPLLAASSAHTNVLIFADNTGTTYTNSWTFTVSAYTTINSNYALASVDTSKPGFKMKLHQMNVNKNPATGLVPNAERQIANGYIDPATGQPYENTADLTGADADGFLTVDTVVNWNQDGTDIGSFTGDVAVPGITGASANTTDRYVASIETILELPAGPIRFGVNSDDGFRLSFGQGPGDVTGTQLGTAGDRGTADSFMDFYVPVAGFYPVRLMWWETGGGSACEFFVADIATGAKTLINGTGANPIKAYRESAASRPWISRVLPAVNYGYSFADQDIEIDITDGAIPLDAGSAVLTLNGAAQTLTSTKSGKITKLVRDSSVSNLLPSGNVSARLVYSYTSGGTAMTATNDWNFIVPRYIRPIPAANKVQASQVSGSGFSFRTHQLDRSLNNNQGNGGRDTGNNMPGPEIQLTSGYLDPLTDQPYPNLSSTGDAITEIPLINANQGASAGGPAANAGIFNQDSQVPGIPGSGTSNFGLDNMVSEITTYLDLKAGAYVLGMNVDDGWTVTSAPNAKDTLGTLIGFRNAPGGQNGNPAHNPNAAFNVVVPEDGIYPFRILFWQGGGGINAEFFAIDRETGTQVLVNDLGGEQPSVVGTSGELISEIKAYSTYNGPERPWTKFSVYPIGYIGTTDPRDTSGGAVTLWQNRQQQSGPGPIKYPLGLLLGSWNSGGIQNSTTAQRPFGDSVGAIVAGLGSGSVGMILDGAAVTPTVTDIPGSTDKLVTYKPAAPLSSSANHTAGLIYAGTTNYWTFLPITNVVVDLTNKVASTDVDLTKRGFKIKTAQATATRANTVAAAEAQLAGAPASVAVPGPEADGSYIHTGIVNFSVSKNTGGNPANEFANFNTTWNGIADQPFPGIPGTGLSGANGLANFTCEIFAFLDLPAGYQKFAINGDDGYRVQIGTPGKTNGPVLFSIDRGAGAADFPFAFTVPEAGLYPVRIVYYQGGGDGNLEFFTYGANNEKIPVNADRPDAIKAYYLSTAVAAPRITKASIAGGNITIEWINGGTLESRAAFGTGAWTSTGDSDGSFSEAAAGTKFYRVSR